MICFALLNGTFFNGRMFVSIFFWGILLYTTRGFEGKGAQEFVRGSCFGCREKKFVVVDCLCF